jgi:hypothetical protein
LLERERRHYEAKKGDLLREAEGRFVLIKDEAVVGLFDTYLDAAREGWRWFGNVPLFVKQIRETDAVETVALGTVDG